MHCFVYLKLPDTILEEIIKELDSPSSGDIAEAMVFNPDGDYRKVPSRSTKVKLLKEPMWVGAFFRHYLNKVNDEHYKFNLSPWYHGNAFQYACYREGDHYSWHRDHIELTNPTEKYIRKLSFSVLLNDDDEGGDLELAYHTGHGIVSDEPDVKIHKAPKKRGQMVIFPSETIHRVTPVTKGIRKSIVGWVIGPPFV